MIIIIDKVTKKEISKQTNSVFPEGGTSSIACKENEQIIRLHDNSDLAKKIMSAKDYKLLFNKNGDIVDVKVVKTLSQSKEEELNKIENKLKRLREERNRLLFESDWTQLPDVPLTAEKQKEWQVYRQALRDITKQDIKNIVFPIPPLAT